MMNFINFAHGEFVMLGMYVALMVVTWLGGGPATFVRGGRADCAFGVLIYLSLIRHVMGGPMLAQILSTFGLALFLRYTAFWILSANVETLPDPLGGILIIFGMLVRLARPVGDHRPRS